MSKLIPKHQIGGLFDNDKLSLAKLAGLDVDWESGEYGATKGMEIFNDPALVAGIMANGLIEGGWRANAQEVNNSKQGLGIFQLTGDSLKKDLLNYIKEKHLQNWSPYRQLWNHMYNRVKKLRDNGTYSPLASLGAGYVRMDGNRFKNGTSEVVDSLMRSDIPGISKAHYFQAIIEKPGARYDMVDSGKKDRNGKPILVPKKDKYGRTIVHPDRDKSFERLRAAALIEGLLRKKYNM